MIVFAVMAVQSPEKTAQALEREYPRNHLQLSSSAWFVAGSGTAQNVYNRLNPTDDRAQQLVVATTAGYWGFAPQNVWEWVKAKTQEAEVA